MLAVQRLVPLAAQALAACRGAPSLWLARPATSCGRPDDRDANSMANAPVTPFSTAATDGSKVTHYQETNISEDELRERKNKAVKAWLDANVGPEKLRLAQILKEHNCLVRGGAEQGQKLMDALLDWKADSAASSQPS